MTSESGSTALRAYRTRPNDHKSQMVLQALLIAAAWNFVMALAVTIYIRSWSGLLALPAEEGVPVLFFFFFFSRMRHPLPVAAYWWTVIHVSEISQSYY